MVNSTCGYDPHRHLTRRGGCGRWVGHQLLPVVRYLRIWPATPHFHSGIAWCGVCIGGFKVKNLGQGVFVRPRTDDDKVAVKGPKLEDLY